MANARQFIQDFCVDLLANSLLVRFSIDLDTIFVLGERERMKFWVICHKFAQNLFKLIVKFLTVHLEDIGII